MLQKMILNSEIINRMNSNAESTYEKFKKEYDEALFKLIDGEEELFGDTAEYNPKNGYATIEGNVYFKKGSDANLSGGKIVYNMNTGIAKILPKDTNSKVSGIFSTKTTAKE